MDKLYERVLDLIKNEDRENALDLCMKSLENNEISVVELYESILAPALNNIIDENEGDEEKLIWKEHVRSGIVRTIIECTYPYVLRERNKIGKFKNKSVIVMCPKFEDHELGARMVSDFFTILGYKTTFIGSNTPETTILKALETIQPTYVCISVTNYYNLVSTKKTIEKIKNTLDFKAKFVLGGYAFTSDPSLLNKVGGDILLRNFQDISSLDEGDE